MNYTRLKNIVKTIFTPVYMTVVIVFMCWFFYKTRNSIAIYLQNFIPGYLLLGAVFLALFYFFMLKAFVLIQSKNACIRPRSISTINWAYGYLYGLIGHYIPGKVSVVLGRIMVLGKFGIAKEAAILSTLYETGISLALAFAMSLPLLFLIHIPGLNSISLKIGLTIIIALALAILLFSPLFQKCIYILLRIFKLNQPDKSIFLNPKTMLNVIVRYFIGQLFLLLAFYFFCCSMVALPFTCSAIYIVGGSMVCSAALGIVALFAPSGLGIREAGIVYFTSIATNLISVEMALLIAVCFRFLTAFVEIVLFLATAFLHKKFDRKNNN